MTGKEILTINSARKETKGPRCPLCGFFDRFKALYQRRYTQHVRLFDSIEGPVGTAPSSIPCKPFLSVLRKNVKLRYNYAVQEEIIQMGVVTYVPHALPECSDVRQVGSDIKYDEIQRQLLHCLEQHPDCERSSRSMFALPYLVLIDCAKESMFNGCLRDEYLTLSYVWGRGPAQNDTAHCTSQLLHDAPLTIRDAMRTVVSLGWRFLWVDRYCIDQNNLQVKELMLEHMDLIYERSIATIVALSGTMMKRVYREYQ